MIAAAAAHANGIALLDSGRAGGDSAATPPGSLGASARSSRVAYRPAARAGGRFGLVCLNARVPSQDGATGNARAARVRVGRGSSVSSVKDVPFMARSASARRTAFCFLFGKRKIHRGRKAASRNSWGPCGGPPCDVTGRSWLSEQTTRPTPTGWQICSR